MGHEMKADDPAAIACRELQAGHHIDSLPTQPPLPANDRPPGFPKPPEQPAPWATEPA